MPQVVVFQDIIVDGLEFRDAPGYPAPVFDKFILPAAPSKDHIMRFRRKFGDFLQAGQNNTKCLSRRNLKNWFQTTGVPDLRHQYGTNFSFTFG